MFNSVPRVVFRKILMHLNEKKILCFRSARSMYYPVDENKMDLVGRATARLSKSLFPVFISADKGYTGVLVLKNVVYIYDS